MDPSQQDSDSPGPVTWCGIVLATAIVLFLMQKILWLVVPGSLALVIYYVLDPFAKQMVLSGCTRNLAAATLSGLFLLVTVNGLMFLYPMVLSNMDSWQDTTSRYLAGGYSLIDSVLKGMEQQFSFARNAHLADALREYAATLQNNFVRDSLGPVALSLAAAAKLVQ